MSGAQHPNVVPLNAAKPPSQGLCVCGWPINHHPQGVPPNAAFLAAKAAIEAKRKGVR